MILKIVREPPPRPITQTLDTSQSYCGKVDTDEFLECASLTGSWVFVSVLLGVLAIFLVFFGCA
jgi:hypothetical protein